MQKIRRADEINAREFVWVERIVEKAKIPRNPMPSATEKD